MPSLRRKSFLLARKERKKKKKEKGRVVFLAEAFLFSFLDCFFFPLAFFQIHATSLSLLRGALRFLVTHTLRVFRIAIEQYNHNYSGLLVLSVCVVELSVCFFPLTPSFSKQVLLNITIMNPFFGAKEKNK